ncbi:PQ loop repeat-domain-containing protein [Syncephalis pseudoplumigaleata]|uniref:PQ loop repeat-domain-containing protein n=1 Tax=Syncephalis pseudoplumigaleata TaxID=1712513 RepID=A0A4P9Z2N0_9FUNG|nr:PQ loop repeat-domain-containing protein [Syncephalis pseudoplumigaleata]|eukprot:RKP26783.1 PQ loop repeat-domain-containing protein [Syncephalis pseudoplumigaleata]
MIAREVFGSLSLLFWSFQLVPQIWKMHREKSAEGVSELMMLIWVVSCALYAAYAVALDLAVTLVIQPELFILFAIICHGQCLYYGRQTATACAMLATTAVCAGLQIGSIYGIEAANRKSLTGVVTMMGIVPAVLMDIGFFPQYWEVWTTKSAHGISYGFLVMDTFGASFAILSLVFHDHFDPIAAATYISVLALDLTLLLVKIALALRDRAKLRREATCYDGKQTKELSIAPVITESTIVVRMGASDREKEAAGWV